MPAVCLLNVVLTISTFVCLLLYFFHGFLGTLTTLQAKLEGINKAAAVKADTSRCATIPRTFFTSTWSWRRNTTRTRSPLFQLASEQPGATVVTVLWLHFAFSSLHSLPPQLSGGHKSDQGPRQAAAPGKGEKRPLSQHLLTGCKQRGLHQDI